MKSRAPEYSGHEELPPTLNPQTLAALTDEPAAAPSASSAPRPAPTVLPRLPGSPELLSSGIYMFAHGDLEAGVDARTGQLVRFFLDGRPLLLADEHADSAVKSEIEGSSLVVGAGDASRRFRLDVMRRCLEVTDLLKNTTDKPLKLGPMLHHRVDAKGGLTFFTGAQLPGQPLKLVQSKGVSWLVHEPSSNKIVTQGNVELSEAWIATVVGSTLVVETLVNAAKANANIAAAYDQASKSYQWVEIAEQLPMTWVEPGASISATFRLYARKLPPGIAIQAGNPELVGFVKGVIQ